MATKRQRDEEWDRVKVPRSYYYRTSKRVRPGDSVVEFDVVLPPGISEPNSPEMYLGKIVDLTASSKSSSFSVAVTANLIVPSHPIKPHKIENPFGPRVTVNDLDRRLADNLNRASASFKGIEVTNRPFLSYAQFADTVERFSVVLPPRTSVFSSNQYFFRALGLPKPSTASLKTTAGKNTLTTVYGYTNMSSTDTIAYKAKVEHPRTEKMSDIWNASVTKLPHSSSATLKEPALVNLFMVIYDREVRRVTAPIAGNVKEMEQALAGILPATMTMLGITAFQLDAAYDEGTKEIVITAAPKEPYETASDAVLYLDFDDETVDFLRVREPLQIKFALEQPAVFRFKPS